MGAPVVAAAAVARSRTGRRVLSGAIVVAVLVNLFILTPLIAIPFALAGQSVGTTATPYTADSATVSSGEWGYPLKGGYTKGRGYGPNRSVGCAYCVEMHEGYDMAQGCGATVYAAGVGEVITASNYQGYGNAVRIHHEGGIVTIYGHMQWGSLRVHVGQHVTTGTPLGAEGSTGRSTGCHLHFEVRKNGTPIDPQPFMAARGLPLK